MRVCDRHPRKRATETILMISTDSQFDLCEECANLIEKFISDTKKETVEPKPRRNILGLKRKSA